MQTILVTGGAGFIGSAVVRRLIRDTDSRVVNVDCLTYAGNLDSLAEVEDDPRYCFHRVDIRDGEAIRGVFEREKPTAVMHLAAESHVDRSIDGPREFIETNVLTRRSKAGSDHLVRAWHHTFGLPVVITNCSNNYGPYQFPEKLIPLMIAERAGRQVSSRSTDGRERARLAPRGGPLPRRCSRCCATARWGRRTNVGGKNEMKNIDVVRMLCRIAGRAGAE
jgi:dTDP-glucose 4,6-dehydratase